MYIYILYNSYFHDAQVKCTLAQTLLHQKIKGKIQSVFEKHSKTVVYTLYIMYVRTYVCMYLFMSMCMLCECMYVSI